MKRIVWTRPLEDWGQDQKILRADLPLFHFPVTKQVTANPELPDKPCEFVILTSRKAAECFLNLLQKKQESLQKAEFLTFGLETYKYLLSQNLKVRLIPAQSGKEFAEALVAELKKTASIWFPRPAETAYAISEHLRAHGIDAYDVEMYRTEAIKNFEESQLKSLLAEPSIVCLASPTAVRAFVDVIRDYDEARFYRYIPVVIGATTLSSCQSYFNNIYQSSQQTLQALLDKAVMIAEEQNHKHGR